MRRGIGRLRAGGSGFSPAQISFTSGLWLDPSDITTGFQDSAGTTPQTVSGQPTGKRLDKSGRSVHVTQATANSRPEYDVISSISSDFCDGTDDGLLSGATTFGADMDCFVAIRRNSTTKGVLAFISAGGANLFGFFDSASAVVSYLGSGTPTQFVNGVAVAGGTTTTRQQLDAALPNGTWVVYELHDLDMSAWTAFGFGNYNSNPMAADIGGIILCPAQSTANRASLRKWLGAKVGLAL